MNILIEDSILNTESDRKLEYNQYLTDHIGNVKKAYKHFLYDAIMELNPDISSEDLVEIQEEIDHHDQSKYDPEEYDAYLKHFYPANKEDEDKSIPENLLEFNYAWLRHQQKNGHHYQHWIIITDSGNMLTMDMPFKYIIGMLADWHSFSAKDSKSTAYQWYYDNKKNILLSDNTRKIVEMYLEYLKKPIK